MFCSKCGAKLPVGAAFCAICGQTAFMEKSVLSKQNDPPAPAEASVPCSQCGASLPAGCKFCLQCGQVNKNAGERAKNGIAIPPLVCGQCHTILPPGSGFCGQCGQALRTPYNASSARKLRPAKHSMVLWFLVLMLVAVAGWAAVSDNPAAEWLQRLAKRSHTQTVTPESFPVKPRSFSYYKLIVPPGATEVKVSGWFSVSGGEGQDIEVYLMSDDAFVGWQNGYTGDTYYRSSGTAPGTVEAPLPAGTGTYYLVFDNRYSAKTARAVRATRAKTVEANLTLSYQRWWPVF